MLPKDPEITASRILTISGAFIEHFETESGDRTVSYSNTMVQRRQRRIAANPSLLKLTAPGAADSAATNETVADSAGIWRTVRPLWIGLALLLVLTPLGILAAGTAWGEWSARDFSSPQTRQMIAAASKNTAPPVDPPSGLERLSTVWTAPFPQYAPAFVRRPALGYVLSAMFGSGAVILVSLLAGSLATRLRDNRHELS